MSFNYYSRKVRSSRLALWVRLAALRSCISQLAFLEGKSYNAILVRLNQKYHFDRYKDQQCDILPNETSLLATLAEVEAERSAILDQLQFFANERIKKKRQGHRQLTTQEQAYLEQFQMKVNSRKEER